MSAVWVLGIDIGGSGSRIALAPVAESPSTMRRTQQGARAQVTSSGSSIPDVATALLRHAQAEWPEECANLAAIGVGATGLATLVSDPDTELAALASRHPGVVVALATDAVTTHLGALGGSGGAVVAVGTGSIAFGTDLHDVWHRVDGWGHLLGDRGGGAWIGMEGLRAAMASHDGVDGAGHALLASAVSLFGDPHTWPSQFYTRHDRAGVLASFVTDVAALAGAGDPGAADILSRAGGHVARSLAAALVPGIAPVVSTSGGVFATGEAFVGGFEREFARLAPEAELRAPLGTSLDGALRLARLVLAPSTLNTRAPHVWVSGR